MEGARTGRRPEGDTPQGTSLRALRVQIEIKELAGKSSTSCGADGTEDDSGSRFSACGGDWDQPRSGWQADAAAAATLGRGGGVHVSKRSVRKTTALSSKATAYGSLMVSPFGSSKVARSTCRARAAPPRRYVGPSLAHFESAPIERSSAVVSACCRS
jgi:hypothetical protein